jgi:hypothetical protein
LEDALNNAREQLDFCSVTGHALWSDMPEADDDIQPLIDYHLESFARLRKVWSDVLRINRQFNQEG